MYALLGSTAVQPKDIINFCNEHKKKNTGLGNALKGSGTWSPSHGNCRDMVIDAFLQYQCTPTVRLCSVADSVPTSSDASRIMNGLPTEHNAFILRWHYGKALHQSQLYGHALCVEIHLTTGSWYSLDSELAQPVLLTKDRWRSLQGSVYMLATRSA